MTGDDDTPAGRELASIQTTMRTDPAAYWRDTAMQNRLGELLAEGEHGGEAEAPGLELMPAAESQAGIAAMGPEGSALVDEWTRSGGYKMHLGNVQQAVMGVLAELPPRRRATFMERFDTLPARAIVEVYRGLALGRPNFVPDATEGEVQAFGSTPEGAELVKEWGAYRAPQKIAIIRDRFTRAVNAMGDAGASLKTWFDGLRSEEKIAVLKGIS